MCPPPPLKPLPLFFDQPSRHPDSLFLVKDLLRPDIFFIAFGQTPRATQKCGVCSSSLLRTASSTFPPEQCGVSQTRHRIFIGLLRFRGGKPISPSDPPFCQIEFFSRCLPLLFLPGSTFYWCTAKCAPPNSDAPAFWSALLITFPLVISSPPVNLCMTDQFKVSWGCIRPPLFVLFT